MRIEKVAIIGAGPAGIAAALQLKRSGITPMLLEKRHIGGLLINAHRVENYPGFPRGISGPKLVRLFEEQLKRVDAKVQYEEVLQLDIDDVFRIKTSGGTLASRIVMIASGTKPRQDAALHIPEKAAKRIFYEVYPLARVRGKRIVIIGAGDAAFDYALNLGERNDVFILNRGMGERCLPLLRERARSSRRIVYRENVRISKISYGDSRLIIECDTAEGEKHLQGDFLLFAIGREPALDFLSEKVGKHISALAGKGMLYLIGDVNNDGYRQISIAVGDGIRAAMDIHQRIRNNKK